MLLPLMLEFEVLVTVHKNIEHQQNPSNLLVAVLILGKTQSTGRFGAHDPKRPTGAKDIETGQIITG